MTIEYPYHQTIAEKRFYITIDYYKKMLIKKLLLRISQYSQENTCVAGLKTCDFIKRRLQYRCFTVNIAKF